MKDQIDKMSNKEKSYLMTTASTNGVPKKRSWIISVIDLAFMLGLLMGSAFVAGLFWNTAPLLSILPSILGLFCLYIART